MKKKNKRGWIRVLEVFFSILLLVAIMMIILNSQVVQRTKKGEEIYKEQALVLKIIQLNDSLRGDVLNDDVSAEINNTIGNTMPNYLECNATICELNEECTLNSLPEDKEIYVKSVAIFANNTDYAPKELKLFCWEK